jgi:hypothetical protein
MPRVGAIFSAAFLALALFSKLFHKRHDFGEKLLSIKYVFRFFLQLLFETSHSKKNLA